MALAPGARVGIYDITAQIGEGGMGQVYRATDTKLKRQVAIKTLPPALAADADRLARFQREAEVLASLNHPNIAAIYGIEETPGTGSGSSGAHALVMELVDGEDLSAVIARGPMALSEAVPIARQIAVALEASHEQGIIHRDLKPANIKVRSDGTVKVLDFGLAKALAAEGTGVTADVMNSPTITTPAMTRAGIILGTAAYMSPEQARGRAVDRRADIWAFGCVLFEMLTGTRTFPGDDLTDTLAAVVRSEPAWTLLPRDVPATLVVFLRRCLEKDPRQRVQAIGDVRLALEGAFDVAVPSANPAPKPQPGTRVLIAVAAIAALAAALATVATAPWWGGSAPTAGAPTRMSILVPANRPVSITGFPTRSVALSPDGTQLAYVGTDLSAPADQPGGRAQLQLRALDTLAVRDLPGTSGARQPFFSPDGQWLGFFTPAGELKKVSLAGGAPITLAQKINGSGSAFAVWTDDDSIIVGTLSSGLRRISAESGQASDLTTVDTASGEFHQFPTLVASGAAVLFGVHYATARNPRIEAVMLDSGARRTVIDDAQTPVVLSSGHLLFQRSETLLAAPFDASQLRVTGPAVPLVDEVARDNPQSPFAVPELAVSSTGTLAYVPAGAASSVLGLVNRSGVFERIRLPPNYFSNPQVSPNGRALAFSVTRGRASEIHVHDLDRGSTTKLTRDEYENAQAWHPDGRSLAFWSRRKEATGIFLKHLDGRERLLVPLPEGMTVLRNFSWSPDGTRLAYTAQTGFLHDIWVLTMSDAPTTEPFLNSAASEYSPRFSPDGKWLAYISNESGRPEVYIQQYPKGERLAVSTERGSGPEWSGDGKELFFDGISSGAEKMMAVSVTPDGTTLRLSRPVPLFDMRVAGPMGPFEEYRPSGNQGTSFDVLPDGRFVMIRGADRTSTREIVVVQHWFEELRRLVPKN